jgi:hypothetical protein
MPGDMAMKWPGSRVVSCKLDDNVGFRRDDLDVATLRILGVGEGSVRKIAVAWSAGCQDEEVMAV